MSQRRRKPRRRAAPWGWIASGVVFAGSLVAIRIMMTNSLLDRGPPVPIPLR